MYYRFQLKICDLSLAVAWTDYRYYRNKFLIFISWLYDPSSEFSKDKHIPDFMK